MSKALNINALIEARGFRKDWLASQLGLHPNSFLDRCHGRTRFSAEELEQLASLLGIHSSVLVQASPLPVRKGM